MSTNSTILQQLLPKKDFTIDVKALSQQNALVNLVLTNEDQMEFDLQMVLAAYDHDHSQHLNPYPHYRYPPGYVYYPTGRAVFYPSVANASEDDLKIFFELIHNVPGFVKTMFEKAKQTKKISGVSTRTQVITTEVPTTDSDIIGQTKGFDAKMESILYFILFAHNVKLTNAVMPHSNHKYKLFEVDVERKSTTDSTIMFHGTHEANLYSIIRNGINPMNGGGVWMTTDINTAFGYARSANKVILCFEAYLNYGAHYHYTGPMALNSIQLRAIIWIDATNYLNCSYVEMASVVSKYLLSK